MRPILQFVLLAALAVFSAPFHVLVDRPGQWEIEWRGKDYRLDTLPDHTVAVNLKGFAPSEIAGDLAAPRLQALIAIPLGGAWKLDLLTDSGENVAGQLWHRVPRFDPKTGKAVATVAHDREGWEESKIDGFRLLRMDFPLVAGSKDGVLLRKHLRMRLTWDGAANLPTGSVWSRVVQNPGGLRFVNPPAPRRNLSARQADLGGAMVEVSIGDDDPFSSAEAGLVRLTGAELSKAAGLSSGGVSISNIAVYSGFPDTLPSAMGDTVVAPGLVPIAIQRIDRNGDGILDQNDEIRFWGRDPNLWKLNTGTALGWTYSINPYTKRRKYLVRMDAVNGSPNLAFGPRGSGPNAYQTVGQPLWMGKPNQLKEVEIGKQSETEPDMGKSWFWTSIETAGTLVLPPVNLSLPGQAADSVLAQIVPVGNSWFSGTYTDIDQVSVSGVGGTWRPVDASQGIWSGTGVASGFVKFQMAFHGSRLAIAGVNLLYRRDLSNADSAVFPAPTMGALDVKVADGKTCWVLENGIATRLCTIQSGHLLDSATSPSTWYALFPTTSGGVAHSVAAWSASSQTHSIKDFNTTSTANILVIAPKALADLAEEYAVHREATYQVRPMKSVIAWTEDIYDLWSGGQMDPVAIRNCIRWAYQRWGISHVLLLGGGHVDPRLVLGAAPEVLIPQWEDESISTDDFYTFLGAGDPSSDKKTHLARVALGRVPARTLDEARAWFDKLKIFETPSIADFGPWRNTVLMVADNVWQLNLPDDIPNHTNQSEAIAGAMVGQRPWIRQEKVYLVKYPINSLFQAPEAARDLQASLNAGVAGMNYMGHGGQTVLADEDVLDNNAVDRTLANRTRPFLFYAGSCTVGRNDVNNSSGLSEYLVVGAGKGAMAAISGTRPSYPGGNTRLATQFWVNATDTTRVMTIGEALLAAKSQPDDDLNAFYTNRDIYNILGDPAMVLLPGGIHVKLREIPDTIQALSRLVIQGEAKGAREFQTRLDVPSPLDSATKASESQSRQIFHLSPREIISLQSSLVSDSISTVMQMPARIAFGDSATTRVYTWNPANRLDGGQILAPRIMLGTATGGVREFGGPSISIRPCDSSWSGGVAFGTLAKIPLPFCLAVDFMDSSGISSDQGPDQGVVFSIAGVREPWHPDLRQDGDYRKATAQLIIDSTLMPVGKTYVFNVLARDLMGNLSRSSLQVQSMAKEEYSLYEVFNSPNPVKEGDNTIFYFKLSSEPDSNGTVDSRVQASIRIHTVSGKLVKVLRTELSKPSQPRPRAVWDLRDSFGNLVANGLYPYTVVLRIPNEAGTNTTEIVRKGVVAISR